MDEQGDALLVVVKNAFEILPGSKFASFFYLLREREEQLSATLRLVITRNGTSN